MHSRVLFPLLVVVAVAAACVGEDPPVPAAGPTASVTPTPTPSPTGASPQTASATPRPTVPMVVAVHPTRQGLDLGEGEVRALERGDVANWSVLGQPPRRLRVGRLAEVRADRDTVAVVPADRVRPPLAVASVGGVDPFRDPATYPLRTTGPEPGPVTTVTVTGDVMLGRRVGEHLRQVGDPAAALRPMAGRLASADLTVGNLESTLSTAGAPRQGGDSFGARPSVRAGLRLAGFDVLSLANNHSGDYGPTALRRTVRRLRAGGFAPLGAGADLAAASRPVVVERNGVRFGFVAFDAIGETPAAGPDRPGALRVRMQPRTGPFAREDLDRVTGIVRDLADRADVVIVLPHWGTQYTTDTVRDQRRVARALVRAGADAVVGGHPHWVQGLESVSGGLVAYSLGNFVFDMDFSRRTQEGAVLDLTFWGSELKAATMVPVVIGPDFAPRVARGERGQRMLSQVWQAGGPPLRGTHSP